MPRVVRMWRHDKRKENWSYVARKERNNGRISIVLSGRSKKTYGVKHAGEGATSVGHVQTPIDCTRLSVITLRILTPCPVVLQLA